MSCTKRSTSVLKVSAKVTLSYRRGDHRPGINVLFELDGVKVSGIGEVHTDDMH